MDIFKKFIRFTALTIFPSVFGLILLSCTGAKNNTSNSITVNDPSIPTQENNDNFLKTGALTISGVSISESLMTVVGSNLDIVSSAKITGPGVDSPLSVEFVENQKLVLKATNFVSLIANKTYELVINSAHAESSATFTISTGLTSCPNTGWALASAGGLRSYNFCIEKAPHAAESSTNAQGICFSLGGSLCYGNEWAVACSNAAALGLTGVDTNNGWLGGVDSEGGTKSSAVLSNGPSVNTLATAPGYCPYSNTVSAQTPIPFRCCKR